MEAEYFPPKEDVILQNEAPTDLYILVSGKAVSKKIPVFSDAENLASTIILIKLKPMLMLCRTLYLKSTDVIK